MEIVNKTIKNEERFFTLTCNRCGILATYGGMHNDVESHTTWHKIKGKFFCTPCNKNRILAEKQKEADKNRVRLALEHYENRFSDGLKVDGLEKDIRIKDFRAENLKKDMNRSYMLVSILAGICSFLLGLMTYRGW